MPNASSEKPLRWNVGDVVVTRIVEHVAPVPVEGLLQDVPPGAVAKHMSWLRPFVEDESTLLLSIHALLLESQGQRIIVDTCLGNDRAYPGFENFGNLSGPFLSDLAAAGFARETVDLVLCTHLHFDHVGWNTMLEGGRWVPTFPNARYLFGRTEVEHWSAGESEFTPTFADTVTPILEAGLADLVDSNHRVNAEIRLEPTPGHTPGHVSVRISSKGQEAVITGDLAHHPLQFAEPSCKMSADSDPARASATRREFVARYGDRPVLVIGTHFAGPTAGHLVRDGDGGRLEVRRAGGD